MGDLVPTTSYITTPLWSGERLGPLKGMGTRSIGESWEVSRLKGQSATLKGLPLSECYSEEELPYLVKFIDTSSDLSVQVHPDDEYARAHENSVGKDECWLILAAESDATILLGLRGGTTKEEFESTLLRGEDPSNYLVSHQVSVGDFFYVPAGTLHAIGKGILLIEVQKSCGITYRVWDYKRLDKDGKPRELHISKALEVIDFNSALDHHLFKDRVKESPTTLLIETPSFRIDYYKIEAGKEVTLTSRERVGSLVVLEGVLKVEKGGQTLVVPAFHTLVVDPNQVVVVSADRRSAYFWVT